MPTLWRYFLAQYLKVLLFCTAAFVVLLLTLRSEEIAHFATLGAEGGHVFRFVLYQIPYILPIALPISALIASTILFRRLSKQHEFTALRAAGFPLWTLLSPLMIAAGFLAAINFYIISESATSAHLSASQIKSQLRSVNPLLLVNNRHLMKLKGIYVDTLGPSRLGESASQLIVAMPNLKSGNLNLLIAENIYVAPDEFKANNISVFTNLENNHTTCSERLLLENISSTAISADEFSQLVQKKIWSINNDHLSLALLSVRMSHLLAERNAEIAKNSPSETLKPIQRAINRSYTEIARRVSASMVLVTFTLLGACCGMNIGRRRSMRGIAILILFSAIYLAAYFSARNIDHLLVPSLILYFAPHLMIITISLWMLNRINRGTE